MNESLDLRKRILKMRESNDIVLSTVKSEKKERDIEKEFVSKDLILEEKEKFNYSNTKNILDENENIKEQSLSIKEMLSNNQVTVQSSNKQNDKNLADTNEMQFRILANKFNEAVEVILELSDKVKNLEQTVYKKNIITKKGNSFVNNINFKTVLSLILIPLLILGVLTLPFDFLTIKLILSDIISSM